MMDSFRIYLSQEAILGTDLLSTVLSRFENPNIHSRNGKYWYSGKVRNLNWYVSDRFLSISGNLSKFHLGNNYMNMTFSDIMDAITDLIIIFGLSLEIATITKIDFGINVFCDHDPVRYFKYLGPSPYFNSRNINDTTLTYSNKSRIKAFYDKKKQIKDTTGYIPEYLLGLNLMRFEVRYRKNPGRYFGKVKLLVSDLFDEAFQHSLMEQIRAEFESIARVNQVNINFTGVKSPSKFIKMLGAFAIQEIGLDKIIETVNECDQLSSQSKSRTKKDCIELLDTFKSNDGPDLYDELKSNILTQLQFLTP